MTFWPPSPRLSERYAALAAHELGQQLGVLVVRMGADDEHALVVAQHPEFMLKRHDAACGGRLELGGERSGDGEGEAGETGKDSGRTTHGPPAGREDGEGKWGER